MTIRPATPDDAAAIAAMLARLAEETGDGDIFASTPETIRAHGFGANRFFEVLVAGDSGREGCALFFAHYSSTLAQPGVYVQDLWVAPGSRGAGLGRGLLAAVAESARAGWGANYLALTAHEPNRAARDFYARLGFEPQDDLVPMVLMGTALEALGAAAEATP